MVQLPLLPRKDKAGFLQPGPWPMHGLSSRLPEAFADAHVLCETKRLGDQDLAVCSKRWDLNVQR